MVLQVNLYAKGSRINDFTELGARPARRENAGIYTISRGFATPPVGMHGRPKLCPKDHGLPMHLLL